MRPSLIIKLSPLILALCAHTSVLAATEQSAPTPVVDREFFLNALKEAEVRVKAEEDLKDQARSARVQPQAQPIEPANEFEKELNRIKTQSNTRNSDLLTALSNEVETLRTKSVVERTAALATQSPRKVRVDGARTVYNFNENAIYEVHSSVEHVTDIQLKPGEQLTTPPTAGDTVRWTLGVMQSGQGSERTTHIVLKPLEENLETNVIITTDQHTYQLQAKSGEVHMPAVKWNYPQDTTAAMNAALKKESETEPTNVPPQNLHFEYTVEGDSYPWKPLRVFDDGSKTYIQMPDRMRVNEAPALFLVEQDEEPMLLNYRVKGSYYIVDRLFDGAEMRVGSGKVVTIRSGDYRPGFFERIFD